MRIDKRWSTFEYCWRFGVRPLRWLVVATIFMWAIGVTGWALEAGSGLAVLACIALYGIWEIGRSIRSITPMSIHVTRGETLIVETGATISVPKADIDRLLESIGRQEAAKKRAA